mmetsp:Transcript_50070/g.145193  ORF Transcript_50070/g.145193 Transcript_50070/m.145193 type:complete len:314 (+) Transcript_50070:2546-3487(+)
MAEVTASSWRRSSSRRLRCCKVVPCLQEWKACASNALDEPSIPRRACAKWCFLLIFSLREISTTVRHECMAVTVSALSQLMRDMTMPASCFSLLAALPAHSCLIASIALCQAVKASIFKGSSQAARVCRIWFLALTLTFALVATRCQFMKQTSICVPSFITEELKCNKDCAFFSRSSRLSCAEVCSAVRRRLASSASEAQAARQRCSSSSEESVARPSILAFCSLVCRDTTDAPRHTVMYCSSSWLLAAPSMSSHCRPILSRKACAACAARLPWRAACWLLLVASCSRCCSSSTLVSSTDCLQPAKVMWSSVT